MCLKKRWLGQKSWILLAGLTLCSAHRQPPRILAVAVGRTWVGGLRGRTKKKAEREQMKRAGQGAARGLAVKTSSNLNAQSNDAPHPAPLPQQAA